MKSAEQVNILLVDDREENLFALGAVLRSPEYRLVSATSGAQALECLAEHDFAVILLDVMMPGMDGLETARRIRRCERAVNTPIILVTGVYPDEAHIRLGYEVGAADFVSKPFDPRILKSKVAVFAELFRKTEKIRDQEKQLHELSESRFRTLFEQSPLAIQLYNPRGECAQTNQAWERLWGEDAPELRALNPLLHPERFHTGPAIRVALEQGQPSDLPPMNFRGKWIESFVYPVHNERGEISEVAVIVKDVSSEKATEDELRRSRDQFRVIFESVADGVVVYDETFKCVYANDAGAQMTGYPSARALVGNSYFWESEPIFDIFDVDGNPVPMDQLPAALALRGVEPAPERIEHLRHRKTGRESWLIVSSRPVLDESGKPYLAVTIFRDITEQRRREEGERVLARATAILASSLDYRASIRSIAELAVGRIADWCKVMLADEGGELRAVAVAHSDPELRALAEKTQTQSPGAIIRSRKVYTTGQSILLPELDERNITESPEGAEYRKQLLGYGFRSALFVPIRGREKMLGTINLAYQGRGRSYDAVDLKLAEELGRRVGMAIENALLYMDAQFQREGLQKAVQARDEFISIAGHELRTPVTALILHSEMALLQLERQEPLEALHERIRKFVTISGSQIDRLSRLIDEMLDVSKIGNGGLSMKFETYDLTALVRKTVDEFSEQLRESGMTSEFLAPRPVPVRCDRDRIEQVVTNLLTNAMKYGEGRPIRISVDERDGKALVTVRDQGIGIARENQVRIFERFERAVSPNASSGLGLGLYIVKKIVEAHGGEVSVQSEIGQGTSFTVTLQVLNVEHG